MATIIETFGNKLLKGRFKRTKPTFDMKKELGIRCF